MAGVLEGLRVLDLTWGTAGPMATMLLGDHGAEVTRIERPAGEPFAEPEGYRVWLRGKRRAALDLKSAADRDAFLALAAEADIVVESFAPGVADRLGIGYDVLSRNNPGLIYCAITAYGRDTRHAQRPGYDALVAARVGLQWEARGWFGSGMDRIQGRDRASAEMAVPASVGIGSDRDGPIFTATAAPSVVAAYQAVLGISAALRVRAITGRGQRVDTSLLQAVIMSNGCGWQRPANLDAPGYQFNMSDKRQTWGIVRAKDGWMCTWASTPEWFMAAGAGDTLRVPDPGELLNRTRGMPTVEDRLRSLEQAAPIFAKFTTAEWTRIAAECGDVSCQPIRSPEEALCDPALLADGSVTEVEDPELGTLRQAGILYRLFDRPARVRGPAAKPGQHTEAVRAEAKRAQPRPDAATGKALARPFEGIRIVDFGAAVAGPWASQLLADMGAEVIKVDPLRQTFWMGCHMSIGVNRSKRFLGLDVKTAAGQRIARQLVESADVVIHNMRPQAARKLGLDYDTLKQMNPGLVYCHTRGFEDGPRSLLPGNDQTGNALGGTEWEDGGCARGGRPWFGTTSNGDLGNGYLAAIGISQALYDRERTGKGQMVDASIVYAALFNCSRVYTTPEGREFERARLDADQRGFSALYRLYRCADDEWLCIAALNDAHWRALTHVLPALATDVRFHDTAARAAHDAELGALLDKALGSLTAAQAFELLDGAGVPCEISSATFSQQLFDDTELAERGWITRCLGNPLLGPIDMFGVGIDFSATPGHAGGPPPVPWQHTREVLAEYGYDAAQIDALCVEGTAIVPRA